jgi:hypothetical protein
MSETPDLTGWLAAWRRGDRAAESHLVAAVYDDLRRIAGVYPPHAQLVDLRFFGGLTIDEAAEVLDRSPAALKRDWTVARAWLFRELGGVGHGERLRGSLPDARYSTSGDR